jgi:methyl-accepting chemotaxis protein
MEEQLRNISEECNEVKVRLSNSEKLLEQGRRERDLLLQEKSSITKSSQKIEQIVETKNS